MAKVGITIMIESELLKKIDKINGKNRSQIICKLIEQAIQATARHGEGKQSLSPPPLSPNPKKVK